MGKSVSSSKQHLQTLLFLFLPPLIGTMLWALSVPGGDILLLLEQKYIISINLFELVSHTVEEGDGTPLQYSCLENPMDRGAWWAADHGVAKSPTRLSDFTFTFPFHALKKEMATHSSVLAWRILGMGEPGGPPSMGLHRVGHD